MRFKMNKLAAAVAATMGVSAAGVGTAQADEILFPYVVASDTVTTLVSTINYGEPFVFLGIEAPQKLHYRYYYKNGANATNNAATCSEVDERLPSSANDIVTFDVSEHFAEDNLAILFEDVATSANVDYGSKTFALLKISLPVRAFLVVDNNDFFTGQGIAFDSGDSIAGEAVVLEFQTGAAWGYSAYNAAGEYESEMVNGQLATVRKNLYDFSDAVETAGEVIADNFVPVALAPFEGNGDDWSAWNTKFFVTPIDRTDSTGFGNQLNGSLSAEVRLAVQDPRSSRQDVMFDRDELPVSGQVPQRVTCVGAVNATDMLTEGARNRVPYGGWSNLVVGAGDIGAGTPPPAPTSEAVVIKLEYNPEARIDIGGGMVTGTVNNAIWLRKGIRESNPIPDSDFTPRVQVYANQRGEFAEINSPSPIQTTMMQ